MKLKLLSISVLALIATLASSYASARDYAIEIVLFVNKAGLQQTAEQFPINHFIPTPTDGIRLDDEDNDTLWQAIPEEEYILNNVVDKLKRSGQYRILKHIAWRQPVAERKDTLPIQITAGRDFTESFPERAYRQIEFSDASVNTDEQIHNKVFELAGTLSRYKHEYNVL